MSFFVCRRHPRSSGSSGTTKQPLLPSLPPPPLPRVLNGSSFLPASAAATATPDVGAPQPLWSHPLAITMSPPTSIGVNLRVTGHCNQGGRKYMEDVFSVAYQQTEDEKDLEYAYFGIFDGHGGREVDRTVVRFVFEKC